MKYCSYCGNPFADDAQFCPNCGMAATPEEASPVGEAIPVTPQETTGEMPQKPKKKRKGLIIAIVAVVLVLAIAAALYFFVFRPTQEAYGITTEAAAEKTVAQLQDVLGDCENLNALCENLWEIAQTEQLTVHLGVGTSDFYSGDESVNMTLHYDGVNSQLGGVIDLNGIKLDYYADEEQLMIHCADFDDSYFMVPLENFGEAFADSALAAMFGVEDSEELREFGIRLFMQTDWNEFSEKNPEIAEFVESLEFVEVDKTIPNAEGMTVYEVSIDVKDITDFYSSYMTYASAAMTESALSEDELFGDDDKITVQIGINKDGCLAAVYLFPEGEDGSVTLVLCGEDNLFEEIRIYENEEQVYTLSLEKTKHGFTLSGGKDELLPLLVCNDDDCELIVYGEDGEELLTIVYGTEEDGVSFETVFTQDSDYGLEDQTGLGVISTDVRITAEIVPFEGVESPDGEVVAFFELTEAELQSLVMRLMGLIYGGYSF